MSKKKRQISVTQTKYKKCRNFIMKKKLIFKKLMKITNYKAINSKLNDFCMKLENDRNLRILEN